MAWKVLGQAALAATTDTDIYTAPTSTQFVARAVLCNRSATPSAVRLAVRPNGATLATSHYLLYDFTLGAYEQFEQIIAGDAADVVTARADAATVTVNVYGSEV